MLQHSLSVLPRLGFHFKTFSSKAIPNCSMQSMPTLRALYLKSFCSKSTVQCSPLFIQSMPILRAFCFFAGTGVIFLYIFACSYFVACLVLDERRRYSWCCCQCPCIEDKETNNRENMENLNKKTSKGLSTCIKTRMETFRLDSRSPLSQSLPKSEVMYFLCHPNF